LQQYAERVSLLFYPNYAEFSKRPGWQNDWINDDTKCDTKDTQLSLGVYGTYLRIKPDGSDFMKNNEGKLELQTGVLLEPFSISTVEVAARLGGATLRTLLESEPSCFPVSVSSMHA
jgi:hypothetical protein